MNLRRAEGPIDPSGNAIAAMTFSLNGVVGVIASGGGVRRLHIIGIVVQKNFRWSGVNPKDSKFRESRNRAGGSPLLDVLCAMQPRPCQPLTSPGWFSGFLAVVINDTAKLGANPPKIILSVSLDSYR